MTPDLLSRPSLNAGVKLNAVEMQIGSSVNWKAEQDSDERIRSILSILNSENKNDFNDQNKWFNISGGSKWFKLRDKLVISNELLAYEDENKLKTVVPRQMVSVLLNFLHDSPLAGHRDFEKTLDLVKNKYFWLNMQADVKRYCESCHLCQTKKYLSKQRKAPLKPVVVNAPWGLIGLDVVGPLKTTKNNNVFIIIAIDYFTKFCVAKAVSEFKAETTAKFVFEDIICRFGMPKSIVSDNGVNFKAKLFEQLCLLLKIKKANSSFYHAPGNGMVERLVKSIKQIMTMYIDSSHSNWDEFLQSSIAAYNASKHASIGMSPYEALFARKPTRVEEVILAEPFILPEESVDGYLKKLKENAIQIREKVNKNLEVARSMQKKMYDKTVKDFIKHNVGDLVLLSNERNKVGESKAFKEHAFGPYRVVASFNNGLNYKIQSLLNDSIQTVHYDRLVRYHERDNVVWVNNDKSIEILHKVRKDLILKPNSFEFEVDEEVVFLNNRLSDENLEIESNEEPAEGLLGVVNVELEVERVNGGKYVCEHCEESTESGIQSVEFDSERELSKHMKARHADILSRNVDNVIDEVVQTNEASESETDDENEGKSACPICGRMFFSVEIHMGKMHKKVVCETVVCTPVGMGESTDRGDEVI